MFCSVFFIDDNSVDNLKRLGFYHMGEGVYVKKFPIYFYNQNPTLYGIFVANNENKDINVDIVDENGNIYVHAYTTFENNDVIKIVNKNIIKEMKKCNITKKIVINKEKES